VEERRAGRGPGPVKRGALLLLFALTGCVYYNGMYNANRFARRAQKAQAQGRTFEAQGFWAQAEVRADTVIARHPGSSWVDDAQLIRGEAMVARNDCAGALPALEAASLSLDSPKVAERARVLLSGCLIEAGNYAAADRVLRELMASSDTAISHPARLEHARVLRLNGEYQAAVTTLEGLEGPAVDAERTADYANLGDLAQAVPLIDSAFARGDSSLPWESIIAGVGRVDPGLASRYTSAAVALAGLPAETRDRLLLADGMRLLQTDPDSGLARLREAGAAKPTTFASLTARLRIGEYFIGQADTLSQLERARAELTGVSEIGGPASIQALRYLRVLDEARTYADSITPDAKEGDLATFALAEAVRDSLSAPRIAAELFATVPAWWPASPYAPKALLALAALEPTRADSIFQTIERDYPESPYLQLVAGDVTPAVLVLEDSMLAYASSNARATGQRRGRPAAAPNAPAGQRPQDDLK
jgi:predicted negative regulator of RcsB-dependent stress response